MTGIARCIPRNNLKIAMGDANGRWYGRREKEKDTLGPHMFGKNEKEK